MSTVVDFTLAEDFPPLTVEEFLALPDNGVHRELIHGRVREMGMTVRNRFHSRIEASVVCSPRQVARGSSPNPEERLSAAKRDFGSREPRNRLVGIDVALVSHELLARTQKKEALYEGPPIPACREGKSSRESEGVQRINGHRSTIDIDPGSRGTPESRNSVLKVGSLIHDFHGIPIKVNRGQTAVTDPQSSRVVKTSNCGTLESRHRIVVGRSQPKDN